MFQSSSLSYPSLLCAYSYESEVFFSEPLCSEPLSCFPLSKIHTSIAESYLFLKTNLGYDHVGPGHLLWSHQSGMGAFPLHLFKSINLCLSLHCKLSEGRDSATWEIPIQICSMDGWMTKEETGHVLKLSAWEGIFQKLFFDSMFLIVWTKFKQDLYKFLIWFHDKCQPGLTMSKLYKVYVSALDTLNLQI